MQEEELKRIWNTSADQNMVKINIKELIRDMKSTMDKFDNKIRKRDITEIFGALGAIFFFAYIGYEFPFPSSKVASIIGIAWGIYVIYRLKSAQKSKKPDDFTQTIEEQLEEHKKHLQGQKKLLSTVWYWYVLPPFLSNAILFIGMGDPGEYDWTPTIFSPPYSIGQLLLILGFLVLIYGYIIWLNLKAVRVNIQPAIQEVEQMQRQMSEN
ncbi:MAG: hypothetical protein R8G66_34795 [Cytophagales bacterium]|nr:hypothetical protein [Cytophagales bacterium]